MKLKGLGLFALGALFGLEGIKLLASKDAKKLYAAQRIHGSTGT